MTDEPSDDDTPPTDALLVAIADANLTDTLKESNVAAFFVRELREETGLPRFVCRLFYNWVVVRAAEKIEDAAKAKIDGVLDAIPGWAQRIMHTEHVKTLTTKFLDLVPRAKESEAISPTEIVQELRPVTADEVADGQSASENIADLIAVLTNRLAWSPPLDLNLLTSPSDGAAGTEADLTRFVARYRAIPYQSAEADTEWIDGFLSSPEPFRWAVVTGAAGSGKTRFALETALRCQGTWDVGFLGKLQDQGEGYQWQQWRPVMPTLIVIDYAALQDKKTGAAIRELIAAAKGKHFGQDTPVRLLLLERTHPEPGKEVEDPLWRRVYGTEDDRDAYFRYRHSPPRTVNPLQVTGKKKIIAAFTDADPETILENLSDIRGGDRPLFIALAADAVGAGRLTGAWDKDALLRAALRGPRSPWENGGETDVLTSFLVALPTIVGEVGTTGIRDAFNPEPGVFQDACARAALLVATPNDSERYPLEPDLLGEAFVLRFVSWMDRNAPPDEFAAFLELIWTPPDKDDFADHIDAACGFVTRCAQDFCVQDSFEEEEPETPSNRQYVDALIRLLSHCPRDGIGRYAHAVACYSTANLSYPPINDVMEFPADDALSSDFARTQRTGTLFAMSAKLHAFIRFGMHDCIAETASDIGQLSSVDDPNNLRVLASNALFNQGVALAHLKRYEDAVSAYGSVLEYSRIDDSVDIRRHAAMCLVNQGVDLGRLQRDEDAIAVFARALDFVRLDDPVVLREQALNGLFNQGLALSRFQRYDEAIAAYAQTLDYARHDDPTDLRETISQSLFNQGRALSRLRRDEDAVTAYANVVDYVRPDDPAELRELAAMAIFNQGVVLSRLQRDEQELAAYVKAVDFVRTDDPAKLRAQAAKALFNQGVTFSQLQRADDELAAYAKLIDYVRTDDPVELRELAVKALFNRGVILSQLQLDNDAITAYSKLHHFIRSDDPAELKKEVAKGLFNQGAMLANQGSMQSALDAMNQASRYVDPDASEDHAELATRIEEGMARIRKAMDGDSDD